MESFYKKWLEKNKDDNLKAKAKLSLIKKHGQKEKTNKPVPGSSHQLLQQNEELVIQSEPITLQELEINERPTYNSQSDIIFDKDGLQLIVEKAMFQRQKNFNLQDHLFYLKIKMINAERDKPLIKDLLVFFEIGLRYILHHIKRFYKKEDHNIAYLVLYQVNYLST